MLRRAPCAPASHSLDAFAFLIDSAIGSSIAARSSMLAGGGSRQLFRLLAQRSARAHVNSIAKPALQQLGDRLLSSRAGDSGVCCAAGGTATCADRLQAATGPHHHQQSARGFAATSYSSGGASSGGPPDPPPDSADAAASSQEAIERQSAEERQRRDGNVGSDIMSQPDPFRPQREEHENDKLLAQWEAMMEANEDPVVVLDTVLGELEDVQVQLMSEAAGKFEIEDFNT